MDKVDFMIFGAVCLLGFTLIIGGLNLRDAYIQKDKLMEQQERKTEALQEENSLLHDDIWNLNQELMKMNEKCK